MSATDVACIIFLITPACMGIRPSRFAGLTATLYAYQRRALAWLLQREGAGLPRSRCGAGAAAAADASSGHPCWRAVRLPDDRSVFVSLLTGALLPACRQQWWGVPSKHTYTS